MQSIQNFILRLRSVSFAQLKHILFVFVVIFIMAKMGQYIFFAWKTSPAVLWPSTGTALAILWLWGPLYVIPIFFALVAASIFGPVSHMVPAIVTTPLGQVIGCLLGVYMLRQFKFDGSFAKMRNVVVFLGVIVISCMIPPTLTTFISAVTGNLTTSAYLSWSRAWAGYVFSCLVITPFLMSWGLPDYRKVVRTDFEVCFVVTITLSSIYLLFWTQLAQNYSFLLFALFFISHLWVGLRFSTRMVTLATCTLAVFGIMGLFISPAPDKLLSNQLFTTELFLFLVIPIFYAFSSLVRERAITIEELKEAVGAIEKENVAKNEFIAVLAHELRNPLAPIKTTFEILALQDPEVDTKPLIKGAQQQVHSMRRLLDDLLDVTRVTQKKFQLQIERAHAPTLIKQSIDSTQNIVQAHEHTVVLDRECDDSLWLDVDPVRFEQVVVNIITNAVKYTPKGGRIDIVYRKNGGSMELRVRDNGWGIKKEYLEDIFKPFWQLKSAIAETGGGIGVGLSLTRHIVEMHNGKIWAESAGEGKGSTFIVQIPLSDKKAPEVVVPSVTVMLRKFKVLVADDNEAAATTLAKLLTIKGHEVVTAYSGKEVFAMLKTFTPEIILLDIGLPDLSGYEITKILREDGFTGTIVALSGYGQKEDKEHAFQAGFNHHITKPMAIDRFEDYLRTLS